MQTFSDITFDNLKNPVYNQHHQQTQELKDKSEKTQKQGGKSSARREQLAFFLRKNKEELWILLVLSGRCFRR